MKSLEKRIEVLEGQQPRRERVVVVCSPGGEGQAIGKRLQEHPEHGGTGQYEIVTVVSVIQRAPNEPTMGEVA